MSMALTFIGMGEAGVAFVSFCVKAGHGNIRAFDIKTDTPGTADAMWAR